MNERFCPKCGAKHMVAVPEWRGGEGRGGEAPPPCPINCPKCGAPMEDAYEPHTITGSQAIRQVYRGGDGMALEPVGPVVREPPFPIAEAFRLGMHVTSEPLHAPARSAIVPTFVGHCPGSPCAVCGRIDLPAGTIAPPNTRPLCGQHFAEWEASTVKTGSVAAVARPLWAPPLLDGDGSTRAPHVATLPDGVRVNLPAGTTLREGSMPPMPKGDGLDACERLGRQLALVAAAPDVEMGPSARKAVGEASKVFASLAQIVRLPSGDALVGKAPERTPEMVLRAMLLAYEWATFAACVSYSQADKDTPREAALHERARFLHRQCEVIRREAAGVAAGYPDPVGFDVWGEKPAGSDLLMADYAARLAGTTPLDAPPAS